MSETNPKMKIDSEDLNQLKNGLHKMAVSALMYIDEKEEKEEVFFSYTAILSLLP